MSHDSNTRQESRNNTRAAQPAEWPGKYTRIHDGVSTDTWLLEYDGKKYILTIAAQGISMVEHKSP